MNLKLEKEVRSGDKGLEDIHIDMIADAEGVDELTMEVQRIEKRTENRSLGTGRE